MVSSQLILIKLLINSIKIVSTCHFIFSSPKFDNKTTPYSIYISIAKIMKKLPDVLYRFSSLSNQDMHTLKKETFEFSNLFSQNV